MLYYITDRHQAGGTKPLFQLIRKALERGIEFIQIREKDWSARELAAFTDQVLSLPNPHGTKILVNGRLDVALACGADGVHLPADSIAPARLRPLCPDRFIIGVSCHSREAMWRALEEDTDYVMISPVFAPLSKADNRPVLGIDGLRDAVKGFPIPSFALGGIQPEHISQCVAVGAPSVAGISLFQQYLLRD
jgi:thiamine-phosphate pyrophosphorylase